MKPGDMSSGPTVVSANRSAKDEVLIHLSRLCIRWMSTQESAKPDHLRMDPTRMGVLWPNVLRMLARSIAEGRMRQREPDEAAKYDELREHHRVKIAEAKHSRNVTAQRQRERDNALIVFVARFFPVPKLGEWNPAFWSPSEISELGRRLAKVVADEEPSAPVWYPDGWRESLEYFGQGVA